MPKKTPKPVAGTPLLDVDAMAAILQVNRLTVYEWARAGRIPAYRLGRRWRFDPEEVKAALKHDGRWKTRKRKKSARKA